MIVRPELSFLGWAFIRRIETVEIRVGVFGLVFGFLLPFIFSTPSFWRIAVLVTLGIGVIFKLLLSRYLKKLQSMDSVLDVQKSYVIALSSTVHFFPMFAMGNIGYFLFLIFKG
jgi:hypothetical protein